MGSKERTEEAVREPTIDGDVRNRISTGIVLLYKQYYGRGPTQTKTHCYDDFILVLLRGGFTPVEKTLIHAGERGAVAAQREAFERVMRPLYAELIERETGRRVEAFLSATHQDPDLLAELFILKPLEGDTEPLEGDSQPLEGDSQPQGDSQLHEGDAEAPESGGDAG